ncbi:DUF4349 domain-containing protein [Isoptericola aurantiacus]|uniref:DUF4349 domain-containing protein n=1 Tax=Isoptericola aurantiacus TaxID=3377839 RepID=UPI00383AA851
MPHRSLLRRAATATAALVLTLGLAACSADDGASGEADMSSAGAADPAADGAADEGAPLTEEAGGDGAVVDEPTAVVDREVVVTGYVELTSADPAGTATELVRMVEQVGGRVEQLTETPGTDDDPGAASAIVRIPADRTTNAVDALGDLATVQRVEISKDDVTSQGQNLDARISALTTSTDRLTELLASAGSTEDLLQVERELADRQAELDSLVAQREALSDQVAMSTIHVDITPETAPVTAPSSGFLDGLATGWSALSATVQTLVLVLGVLLPWLALAAVAYLVVRWLRRRRRSGAGASGAEGSDGDDDGRGDGPDGPPAPPARGAEREPALMG